MVALSVLPISLVLAVRFVASSGSEQHRGDQWQNYDDQNL